MSFWSISFTLSFIPSLLRENQLREQLSKAFLELKATKLLLIGHFAHKLLLVIPRKNYVLISFI